MASERLRSLRRVTFLAAGVFAAASVLPSPVLKSGPTTNPAARHCAAGFAAPVPAGCAANGATGPSSGEAHPPAFGAYLNYGPLGVKLIQGFSDWLDHAEVRVGHTYLPGDQWSNIEGAHHFLDSWADWRRAKDDRLLVVNVPMMDRNEDHLPDAEVARLMRRAAAGEFDQHFRVLAERLVALGVPDTILVPGWEMNGISYTHRCGPDPDDWKTYWRRIITVMRSVPGQNFRFDFTPDRGVDAIPWPQCYPGDDVVDIIGMDSYDQPEGISFDQQISEPYGLQYQVDFAKTHGKPTSYPEWGLFRNGDNPTYMLRMLAWMDENKPLYHTVSDYCPHGVWLCSANPRSSAIYRALFSDGHMPGPTPNPMPEPSVRTTPVVPPHR
ncbi:glycoside hydrolase family 26 protein [Streptomyces sp. IMTB 2501]|uniref:glycoside hydrolase family 26 protein n=1 Tax=Streptomyces sp. IMTB 2501 TaxID=1776340 RepID=UPI000D1A1514|nr:glycosyl hydrolase [Streptomyces sp. IMTB 2501]